jgi:hypothetical protein
VLWHGKLWHAHGGRDPSPWHCLPPYIWCAASTGAFLLRVCCHPPSSLEVALVTSISGWLKNHLEGRDFCCDDRMEASECKLEFWFLLPGSWLAYYWVKCLCHSDDFV